MSGMTKTQDADGRHTACRDAFVRVIAEHQKVLTPQEMLAIASQLVGQLIAMQDQTKMTTDMAAELVRKNIEIGNHMTIEVLTRDVAGNA